MVRHVIESGEGSGVPKVGTTAVLAAMPVADELLSLASAVDARLVRPGVPAHAALAYPWLPVDEVTDEVVARLRELVAGTGPIGVRLASVVATGDFVGIEVPELAGLASTVRAAWPDAAPYGGRFGADPPVHVTIAMDATPEQAVRISGQVDERLPLTHEVTELTVVGLTDQGWRPLAGAALR